MGPASGLQDRPRLAIAGVEATIAGEGVGLEHARPSGEMALGMLAAAVAGVVEHRRRRSRAPERSVVQHIDPKPGDVGLARRQHLHRRVVAVQPGGGEDVALQGAQDGLEHLASGADRIGGGGQGDGDAFQGEALAEPVQRLVGAELLIEDHRQQARPGPAARDHVEGRGGLADPLAVAAGERLPHRLHHLPAARDRLQRTGDVLTELAQPGAPAALASGRWIDDHALPGQVLGEGGPRLRPAADEG